MDDSLSSENGPIGKVLGFVGVVGNIIWFSYLVYGLFGWEMGPPLSYVPWWLGLLLLGVAVSGFLIMAGIEKSAEGRRAADARRRAAETMQYEIWSANHPVEAARESARSWKEGARRMREAGYEDTAAMFDAEAEEAQRDADEAEEAQLDADEAGGAADHGDDQGVDPDATGANESKSETNTNPDTQIVPPRSLDRDGAPLIPGIVQNTVPQAGDGLPRQTEKRSGFSRVHSATVLGGIGLVIAVLDLLVNVLK